MSTTHDKDPGNSNRGDHLIVCSPRMLPRSSWVAAAQKASDINPANHPPIERLGMVVDGYRPTREQIAVLTTKWWRSGGVHLTVGFLDNPPSDLQARILLHMNAWGTAANVSFVPTQTDPQVRIAMTPNAGYWSYVGTDILSIAVNEPTMNLESFTMRTPESEFHRVVRHETGHTMGCPHEHMRRDLVARIDRQKAIAYFWETQGWDEETVVQQVLTPIEESSLLGTAHADQNSIMCYQLPGTITTDGEPIIGGPDIDAEDYAFMAKIYPKIGTVTDDSQSQGHETGISTQAFAGATGTVDRGTLEWPLQVAMQLERYAVAQKYPFRVDPRDVYEAALKLCVKGLGTQK